MLQKLRSDMSGAPHLAHQVIFLGDYIDRGGDSAGSLETLIAFGRETPSIFLKGNHEAMLLEFLANPMTLGAWAEVGGLQTLSSYGLSPPLRPRPTEAMECHAEFRAAVPPEHLTFIVELKSFHIMGDYFFAHAGVRPHVALDAQAEHDLLWIRDDFLQHTRPFDKCVVHGHTPVKEAESLGNRINVDTGAFVTGRLTAVVLEGSERRFLSATSQEV